MTYDIQKSVSARADISLGEIGRALWRRRAIFLLIFFAALSLAAIATHRTSKRWRAEAQMALIERATNTSSGPQTPYAAPVIETVDSQIAMLQSAAMSQRVADWLNDHPSQPEVPESWTPATLPLAVTVANPKDTDVIEVMSDADNPDRAARFANAFCLAFLQWKKELAQRQVQGIAQSLQVRSARAKAQMQAAEQQEKQFKQSHHMADVATQEKFLLDSNQSQSAEVDNLEKESESLNARLRNLGGTLKLKNSLIQQGGVVRDDSQVLSLQSQLTQLEIERSDDAAKYTANYPNIFPPLDAKIRDTKARLSQAIHGIVSQNIPTLQSQGTLLNDYQETQVNAIYNAAKLAAARKLLGQTQAQTTRLPQIDGDYKQIVRNVDLTNTLYLSLQSSLEAARLDQEIAAGNVQFTQPAMTPVKPYRPNLAQNLSLAGLIGLFLGSLAVILLEQGDRRVRTISDMNRLLSAPVIGSLPVQPSSQAATLTSGNGSAKVMEAYRLTYANLLLTLHQSRQSALRHRSVILVTSALPGEGKTVTAQHLARAIARCGKRTILVDADLRVPTGSKAPNSSTLEPIGLADVLRNKVVLEEAIVESVDSNLLLLPRGRVNADSADMVSLPQMKQVLATLRTYADVVIIDSPACLERADVFFLAPEADCILQVVGAKKADESAMKQAFDALSAARPSLMALFLNFSSETRSTLVPAAATASAPPFVTLGAIADWDSNEKVLLSENKTTKIIVQSFPSPAPKDGTA